MKYIILLVTLFGSFFSANAQQSDVINVISPTEFNEAIKNKNVQLVDVRTKKEFEEGAIKNALNIDYFNDKNFKLQFDKLNKEKPVYIYCKSGNRSQKAAAKLEKMGFQKIYELKGGYMGWPVKK